ncbi:MAG TPA: SRPBCC domain-containing protein [Isosphaeraceae bacterium]|nr:SRPBCC domain-containing protein [Isosphaeraceae bacterium]
MSTKKARSYEKNFEVAAPVESVWKAITEGDELTRWFCQEARCEPDIGGQQHIDWGGGAKATGVITVWKPNSHLRTEAVRPDLDNSMSAGTSEPYATDWYLEHQGGVTRVRMVASGFGEGPDWDHEYDGTFHGWDMFHKTMKHYLEHHRGHASANVVLYAVLSVPPSEAWSRLMSAEGLIKSGSLGDLIIGAPFRFETSQSDPFAGVVHNYVPGKTFSAMVENLNKAILNIELSSVPGQGHVLYVSLNTWGLPKPDVDALAAHLKAIVYGLFPQKTETPYSACAVNENG